MTVAETLPPREHDRGSLILLETHTDDGPLAALTPSTDTLNERAVLGALMHPRNTDALHDVTATLNPADFTSASHEAIYAAVLALYARGRPVDPLTVSEHIGPDLRRHGGDAYLHQLVAGVATTSSAGYHATLVAKAAAKRRLVQAGQRIQALGTGPTTIDTDVTDLLDAAENELAALPRGVPGVEETVPGQTIDEFLASDDPEYDWLVEGLLERADRLILTGPEGGGKSTLLRQIGIQLATGIHPFTGYDIIPKRVLLLDLENSERQNRRKLRALRLVAGERLNPKNLIILCKPDGLDLTDRAEEAWLEHLLEHHKPDVLVTGPIYKLAAGNPNDEAEAKPAAMALDRLRTVHDCAVLLEAHSAKASAATPKKRPKEPFGWSGWMRWPEFGLHIDADGDVAHWRGMREEREFPETLVRGGRWPWMPTLSTRPDDIHYRQIVAAVTAAGQRLSNRELARRTGISEPTIRRSLEVHGYEFGVLCSQFGDTAHE